MRMLVLVIIGLLVAGQAGADRKGYESRWQGYQSQLSGQSEYLSKKERRMARKAARRDYSSRLKWLRTTGLNSGVCDELKGSSRSLRMMCMAFCEMQTCTPDYTLENPYENCSRSSKWILARYEKHRGAGDPDMPCIKQPAAVAECPCWTREELAGFRGQSADDRVASCALDADIPDAGIANYDNWQIFNNPRTSTSYMTSLSTFGSYGADQAPTCAVTDTCDPTTGICLGESRLMSITTDQLAACEADLALSASDRLLTCN